jgi:hypothetical protein
MREAWHDCYCPRAARLEELAPAAYRTLVNTRHRSRRHEAEEHEHPDPVVVEALERYVDALSRADRWETKLSGFLGKLKKAPDGVARFRELVRHGANPHLMAQLVEGYWREPKKQHSDAPMRNRRERLRRAAHELESAASAYETALDQLRPLHFKEARLEAGLGDAMQKRAGALRNRADSLDVRRRLTPRGELVDLLQEHIAECTGRYHDPAVADLLVAISVHGDFDRYTEKDLEERRLKHRKQAERSTSKMTAGEVPPARRDASRSKGQERPRARRQKR